MRHFSSDFQNCFSQFTHRPFLGLVFCLVNENALNCTSGRVLLCFFSSSIFLLRPHDVTTTSNLLFVHSFMQFKLRCVLDVIFHSQWSEFFVHSRDQDFGHT